MTQAAAQHPPAPPTRAGRAFLLLQRVLPRRTLSALVYRVVRSRKPWIKNPLIRGFAAAYGVRLDEARVKQAHGFATFNDFFTRALEPQARPLPSFADAVCSPCDGCVVQAQVVEGETLLQAKGIHYSLAALLAGHPRWPRYAGGVAVTVYLAPADYHRVHMPIDGRLVAASHVPGDRYSVNAVTTSHLAGLFTRNERVVCHFDTAVGPMAVVLVGALNVGSISTVWDGEIRGGADVRHRDYPAGAVELARGEELGCFNMGSTVILLLPERSAHLDPALVPGRRLRMGETIARLAANARFARRGERLATIGREAQTDAS